MTDSEARREQKERSRQSLLSSISIHPEIQSGPKATLVEKRNLISSVFIAMLIGLAYQEMAAPVRESVRSSGITLGTVVLFLVFFLTSMRFFIGNQLHLLSEALVKMRGDVWLYDFMVITFQTILLTFLGGASCVEVCRVARIDFVEIILALYTVDVLWIVSQWGLGKIFSSWRRGFVPWAWAILNTVLVICIGLLYFAADDVYSNAGLVSLGVLNVLAFVVDVVLVDHYSVI